MIEFAAGAIFGALLTAYGMFPYLMAACAVLENKQRWAEIEARQEAEPWNDMHFGGTRG